LPLAERNERLHAIKIFFWVIISCFPIGESRFETRSEAPESQPAGLRVPPSWLVVALSLRWFEPEKNVEFVSLSDHVNKSIERSKKIHLGMSLTLISI
jgi:hypothetical protein